MSPKNKNKTPNGEMTNFITNDIALKSCGNECNDIGKTKWTTNCFILRASKKHNGFYDYRLVYYENSNSNVKIICPVHGVFVQLARHHLSGSGCKNCHFEKIGKHYAKTSLDFIQEAKTIHKNTYDYSNVIYKNWKTKVIIKIWITIGPL